MIRSFKDRVTEAVFEGRGVKGVGADVAKAARRRLAQLDAAGDVEDLRSPPGNNLHALQADRSGHWAVRVNDQFRLCFRWGSDGPEDVELVDYH